MRRTIRTMDDVLGMLDRLFVSGAFGAAGVSGAAGASGAAEWWDGFYADRDRAVPFFVAKPDENLMSACDRGLLVPGRALDLGCGPGRNAVYLASLGFSVDAVDLSPAAVAWAVERAREAGVRVRFHCASIFSAALPPRPYDLVYDSGCLHHLPPHRRVSYLGLLDRVLAPGGYFAVACFAAGAMGCELADEELYREGSLGGGLAYSPEELRWVFSELTEVEMRPMAEQSEDSAAFGVPFLLTALFRRPAGGL
jgi:SAM-dependent methyltransferase